MFARKDKGTREIGTDQNGEREKKETRKKEEQESVKETRFGPHWQIISGGSSSTSPPSKSTGSGRPEALFLH